MAGSASRIPGTADKSRQGGTMRKIVDTILPTTMVGSYPRPHWFTYQLSGRDVREAFKHVAHEEAYADATRVIIQDQEEAGLDIVCDGQMYFDDYVGSIGSFCWYIYERIPGFDPAKEEHPAAAGANFLQYEDLGAWLPLFTKENEDFKWIGDVVRQCIDGVDAKIAWHFCYGNAWGNRLAGLFPAGYEAVLPHFYDLPIDQFVLDFANRDMVDIDALKDLPADKEVAIGVIDVRTSMIETPEEVAARIRKVIEVVPPERVYLTTDCGMKPLSRIVARMKLKALADGAKIVRKELGHG